MCHYCKKKGHIIKACMKKKRDGKVHNLDVEDTEDQQPLLHIETATNNTSTGTHVAPIIVSPKINAQKFNMELAQLYQLFL